MSSRPHFYDGILQPWPCDKIIENKWSLEKSGCCRHWVKTPRGLKIEVKSVISLAARHFVTRRRHEKKSMCGRPVKQDQKAAAVTTDTLAASCTLKVKQSYFLPR
jgi:Tfp pilus assembly major pilin PilA